MISFQKPWNILPKPAAFRFLQANFAQASQNPPPPDSGGSYSRHIGNKKNKGCFLEY
jgi:hypothetical protein